MSEQQQERDRWYVDAERLVSYGMYAVVGAGGDTVARVLEEDAPLAQQIADDHNMRPQLLTELERTRVALEGLVETVNKVYMTFLIGYTATEGNGLLDLLVAIERAEVALTPTGKGTKDNV